MHPRETSQIAGPQVTLREVENLGHLTVLFDREVGDAVCEFLLQETAHGGGEGEMVAT